MVNLLYIIAAILVSSTSLSFAQESKGQHPESFIQFSGLSDQQKLKELVSIHQGTYQLIISNENYAPLLNLGLFETISTGRQQSANVLIEIDEFTKVFIPSQDTIESEQFVSLETIIYNTDPTSVGISE